MFPTDWPGFRRFWHLIDAISLSIYGSANSVRIVRNMFVQPTFFSCTSFLCDSKLLGLNAEPLCHFAAEVPESIRQDASWARLLFVYQGGDSKRALKDFGAERLHATASVGSLTLG